MIREPLILMSGRSNSILANEISEYLGIKLGDTDLYNFSDGEIYFQSKENIRGSDVFIIQSTSPPTNENLMELLIIIDACRRASAERITAVIPYYGYARQDRKDKPRVPITSKLVANLLTVAGTDRVLTIDLHAGQIQGYFDIPVDHLYAMPVLVRYVKKLGLKDFVTVSPDIGGVVRARAFAGRTDSSLAIIEKRRTSPNEAEVMNIIGNIEGMDCVLLDDMIDTAGTIVKGTELLLKRGAKDVKIITIHGVLSGPALERLENCSASKIILTNTILPKEEVLGNPKFEVISVGELLGEAISRIHSSQSVHSLFN